MIMESNPEVLPMRIKYGGSKSRSRCVCHPDDLSMEKSGTSSRESGKFWNERALCGSFARAGNLLAVLSATVKFKHHARMPLTDRDGLSVGDKPRAEGVSCQSQS
jgi:hypothetical protein